jgi:hypothetical protein
LASLFLISQAVVDGKKPRRIIAAVSGMDLSPRKRPFQSSLQS